MDMTGILQFALLGFGALELWNAAVYRRRRKNSWAAAALGVGILACACAVVSMTGAL